MREIKFRARWRDTLKKVIDFNDEYTIAACEDDAFIVEQFTGLKDKNGVDIYEGDILINPYGKIGSIVFYKGSFRLKVQKLNSIEYDTLNVGFLKNKEVIGNIHEHKHLLK